MKLQKIEGSATHHRTEQLAWQASLEIITAPAEGDA
jgi:hypothetical protein